MSRQPDMGRREHGDTVAPIDSDARIQSLDILRGLALFGMILVHFHQKMRADATGIEDLIPWGVWIFVEQKAWGTFAFLFGVGFAVLLRRLEARAAPITLIYLRRLAGLAAFGVVAEVCFGFTILFTYASWGTVLLLIRRWPTRMLLGVAILAAAAGPLVAQLDALPAGTSAVGPPSPDTLRLVEAVEAASHQGDYGVLLLARWRLFAGTTPGGWRGLLPDVNLALFVIGLLAVRYHVLDEPLRHTRLIAGWMVYGIVAWVASWTVVGGLSSALPAPGWPLASLFGLVQDQWLCFTYVGAVVLILARRPLWGVWLAPIGQAGRMALTNYMLQVAVLDYMASGYGLGLRLRPFAYVPAALLLFGAECLLSGLWLERFRYGPLEWAWRVFTYARPQAIVRSR